MLVLSLDKNKASRSGHYYKYLDLVIIISVNVPTSVYQPIIFIGAIPFGPSQLMSSVVSTIKRCPHLTRYRELIVSKSPPLNHKDRFSNPDRLLLIMKETHFLTCPQRIMSLHDSKAIFD